MSDQSLINKLKTSSAYLLLNSQTQFNLINIIKSGNKILIKMIEELLKEEEQLNSTNLEKLSKRLLKAIDSTTTTFFKNTKLPKKI